MGPPPTRPRARQPSAHSPGTTAGLRAVGTAGHRPAFPAPVDRLPSCPSALVLCLPSAAKSSLALLNYTCRAFPVASRPPRSRGGGRARGFGGRGRGSRFRVGRSGPTANPGTASPGCARTCPRRDTPGHVTWCGAVRWGGRVAVSCGVARRGTQGPCTIAPWHVPPTIQAPCPHVPRSSRLAAGRASRVRSETNMTQKYANTANVTVLFGV